MSSTNLSETIEKSDVKKQEETLEKVVCLNQLFRPSSSIIINGYGNCMTCQKDSENNGKCKGYYPIKIMTFYVE